MDEFAMGSSGETSAYGVTCNPWDISRAAGGSSSGSAAAIIAGEVPITLGTDTGGSIRRPCAFCGITGIKPTYGSVSRFGIVAYASSLDQVGPMGQDIEDCAELLSIISGPDKRDSTCIIKKPFDFKVDKTDVKNVKIGIPHNYFSGDIDEDVKTAVLAAAKEFETAGAIIEEFEMPMLDHFIPIFCIIRSAELSSNLSRYDGLKFGHRSTNAKTLSEVYKLSRSQSFGLEVKRRIMLGSLVLSSDCYDIYFKKALQGRSLIRETYKKLFGQFDMILSPVAQTTANKISSVEDPMKIYMKDIYTVSVNLAGLPAVSLPCGFDRQGLPIGFQLIGEAFSDSKLINAARIYQRRTDYHTKRPGGTA
jgi:aspartyl-tRNA(Asn)/glutamyl-tRNA(Gln) amidotransferase subunit A